MVCIGFLSFGTERVLINIDVYSIQLNKNTFHNSIYKILCVAALCCILCVLHMHRHMHLHLYLVEREENERKKILNL